MPKVDFQSPRLYVDTALAEAIEVRLDRSQSHYLGNVMRLRPGAGVLVFNGRDGEWQATIDGGTRRDTLTLTRRVRPQDRLADITYAFAPLKHARLDYMVQKAVEMGVARLQPVLTRFTQVSRINLDRMRANVVEAAEQCGLLSLAEVCEPVRLDHFLASRDAARRLVFCDEWAEEADPVAALRTGAGSAVDLVVGPEGGFADDERVAMLQQPEVIRLALGPRILRADTAAVAALALVQATFGDWR